MFLCLSDGKQPTASWEHKTKLTRSQELQIAYGNEKLDTILSQLNALENSRQLKSITQSGFHPLARIITERLDNIQMNQIIASEKRLKKSVKRTQQK